MLHAKAVSRDNDVVNKKDEDFNEDFDHVSLKQRQRMLLSREPVRPNKPAMEYVDDGVMVREWGRLSG
ncbi:hypothetical protein Hdeb2414_s0001g00031231 [Helianthus debilis subsp. tardiflorus]